MMKSIGLLLGVLAIWTTVEIYTNGTQGAFGGALASFIGEGGNAPSERSGSAPKRAGAAVERAHEQQQERYESLLGE